MNDFPDPLTGKDRLVEDRQMMFMITPEEETFPRLLGMKREQGKEVVEFLDKIYQPIS